MNQSNKNKFGIGKDKKKGDIPIDIKSVNGAVTALNNDSILGGLLGDKSLEDSFEKFYNKDLDLDEGNFLLLSYSSN